jgi:hypothetical protein
MTKAATGKKAPKEPPESFAGRSYTCCRGPRKGQVITVIRVLENGKRCELEAEKGGRWSISREKLCRIFGPAGKRVCQCSPLDLSPEEITSLSAETAEAASESSAGAEDEEEREQPPAEEAEVTLLVKAAVTPERETSICEPPPKQETASDSLQGTLF